jgi:hypothetical protein
MFHLDEYISLPASHPASFVAFSRTIDQKRELRNTFAQRRQDPADVIRRVERIALCTHRLSFVGIGEWTSAFNVSRRFETEQPYRR